MGFFEKLKQGLSKTASSISSVFTASELDDEFYDDLEESLIVSDLGMDTTEAVMDRLRQTAKEQRIKTVDEAKVALRGILADMLNVGDPALKLDTKPSVILVIGVNGVGKTTTIGKLAHQLHDQGKKVLLCAGDTFRAAAADQLESGRSVRTATLSASMRAPIPPPSSLMLLQRQEHAAATSSSATQQAACTTSRTS